MGPTGTPTEIHADTPSLLVGGGLGNAVLFSIGAGARAAGSKVIYFAGYKKLQRSLQGRRDREGRRRRHLVLRRSPRLHRPTAPQDRSFVGNIVQAMAAYAAGRLGDAARPPTDAERIIAIGSDRMMAAVGARPPRRPRALPQARPHRHRLINSPMQCMMKEICAQCLQPHTDPATGARPWCSPASTRTSPSTTSTSRRLNERLGQNTLAEKLTAPGSTALSTSSTPDQ